MLKTIKNKINHIFKSYLKEKNMPVPGFSHEDLGKNLKGFISWLENNGVKVNPNSRLFTYIKELEIQTDLPFKIDNLAESKNLFHLKREVFELCQIYEGLKIRKPKGVISILKNITEGKPYVASETKTKARNYQLELRIASYFLMKNYDVDMSDLSDIVAYKKNITFYLECKRISSNKQVSKRAKEAAKQLKLRIKKNRKVRNKACIAVFDVTKVVSPKCEIFISMDDKTYKEMIKKEFDEIVDRTDFDSIFYGNKNIIGVWLQVIMPSALLSTMQPATRFSSQFYILAEGRNQVHAFNEFRKVYECLV